MWERLVSLFSEVFLICAGGAVIMIFLTWLTSTVGEGCWKKEQR